MSYRTLRKHHKSEVLQNRLLILSFVFFISTGAFFFYKNSNYNSLKENNEDVLASETNVFREENEQTSSISNERELNPQNTNFFSNLLAQEQNVLTTEPTPIIQPMTTCPVSEIEVKFYEDKETLFEKNNKYGLYIYAEREDYFDIASELINSNGGEWGYVLIPFNVKDNDESKWKRVFKTLNEKKMIPIIQLWDIDTDKFEEQTLKSAEFLNKFDWPIRERYISAYNEMNDSRFWYGRVDPEEYAVILNNTIDTYKNVNPNFFIMNGAFNTSAPTDRSHLDAFEYKVRMNKKVPGIFEKLDGWASHPYPQPNFTASPFKKGRWGISAYEEELKFLKDTFGLKKELPVFITETGWARAEGENYNSSYLNQEKVAEYYQIAYEQVWLKDSRVRAVTPFTIRYKAPHDHFSWIDKNEKPYPQYNLIKSLPKVAGEPPKLKIEKIKTNRC